jgi:hypothetical protein
MNATNKEAAPVDLGADAPSGDRCNQAQTNEIGDSIMTHDEIGTLCQLANAVLDAERQLADARKSLRTAPKAARPLLTELGIRVGYIETLAQLDNASDRLAGIADKLSGALREQSGQVTR